MKLKAIGENIILVSNPPKAGDEQVTAGGIIMPALEQGGLPEYCLVYAIGESVPEGIFEVGDKTALPLGQMKNVPHPDVISGAKQSKDIRESFVTCHWKNIPCVYK